MDLCVDTSREQMFRVIVSGSDSNDSECGGMDAFIENECTILIPEVKFRVN